MTVFVIMGVSGCGKTTFGMALADKLGCSFYDGDDFHPSENVAKMASGTPLTDADRHPWLERLRDLIGEHLEGGKTAVIACSALKKRYRDQLRRENDGVSFVFLQGGFDQIWERMQARQNHYMRAEMLHSQFDALEPPGTEEAIIINIDQSVESMLDTSTCWYK